MAESRVIIVRQEKSMAVAYVLLIFLGGLGIHRFYLGRVGSGIAQLLLTLIGCATVALFVGFLLLIIVGLWLLVDLFLTAGMVHAANAQLQAVG